MLRSSMLYRILLTVVLTAGFFVYIGEGMSKKYFSETLSEISSVSEDADDEMFPMDAVPAQDPSILYASSFIDAHKGDAGDAPVVNSPKLFLLYQQWKLHC